MKSRSYDDHIARLCLKKSDLSLMETSLFENKAKLLWDILSSQPLLAAPQLVPKVHNFN